jgi:uncharacterized protein (TIGR02996 family)
VTHDDAFLQAILESPDDDTPRLVYADYLDEHGDSDRAEFIRIQVALASLPPDDRRRKQLGDRERQLLAGNWEKWLVPLRPLLSGWAFRRGFLNAITVPAATYLQHATIPHPATSASGSSTSMSFLRSLTFMSFSLGRRRISRGDAVGVCLACVMGWVGSRIAFRGATRHRGMTGRMSHWRLKDCTFRDFLTQEEAVSRGFSGLFQILEGISGLRKQPLLPE